MTKPSDLSRKLQSAEERALDHHDRVVAVYPQHYAPGREESDLPGWPNNLDRIGLEHRDSDHLTQSNAHAIRKALSAVCERWTYKPDPDSEDSVEVETYMDNSASHWAVGWVDTALVIVLLPCDESHPHRASTAAVEACGLDANVPHRFTDAFLELCNLRDRLEAYPALDEEDWGQREHEAKMEEVDDALRTAFRRDRLLGELSRVNCDQWRSIIDWLDEHAQAAMEVDGWIEPWQIERAALSAGLLPGEDLVAELLSDWNIYTERSGRWYLCRVQGNVVTRRRTSRSADKWLAGQALRVAKLYSRGVMGPHAGG